MSDDRHEEERGRKACLGGDPPAVVEHDYPLRTPKQIRDATMVELRRDERVWAAFERGLCECMRFCIASQLMQTEMRIPFPVMRPEQPSQAGEQPMDPALLQPICACIAMSEGEPTRIKRTNEYADVRDCEYEGTAPEPDDRPGEAPVVAAGTDRPVSTRSVATATTTDAMPAVERSMIRIKITTPESTEIELEDETYDDVAAGVSDLGSK